MSARAPPPGRGRRAALDHRLDRSVWVELEQAATPSAPASSTKCSSGRTPSSCQPSDVPGHDPREVPLLHAEPGAADSSRSTNEADVRRLETPALRRPAEPRLGDVPGEYARVVPKARRSCPSCSRRRASGAPAPPASRSRRRRGRGATRSPRTASAPAGGRRRRSSARARAGRGWGAEPGRGDDVVGLDLERLGPLRPDGVDDESGLVALDTVERGVVDAGRGRARASSSSGWRY